MPPTGYGVIPNEEDCNKFYICVNGDSYLLECVTGYNFDCNNGKCVFTRIV
ncbi:carbohydrate-binding module family 14 protein [Sphingobacterium luzhongxinii]|uniref:carbohydrate-binding module family 14 protein n=1 Tax=Sphingobacterium TaxID=28453 RepID=UPI0013D91D7D